MNLSLSGLRTEFVSVTSHSHAFYGRVTMCDCIIISVKCWYFFVVKYDDVNLDLSVDDISLSVNNVTAAASHSQNSLSLEQHGEVQDLPACIFRPHHDRAAHVLAPVEL